MVEIRILLVIAAIPILLILKQPDYGIQQWHLLFSYNSHFVL